MKKNLFFFLFFLLIFQNLLSQKKVNGRMDFNIGFNYVNDIQINKILKTKNLPEVKSLNNYVGFNIDVYFKKFIFSPEFGILNSRSKKDDYNTDVSGLVGSIGMGYTFLKTGNIRFSLLGVLSSCPTEIKLSYSKSSIDISSIDPKINSGLVNFYYVPINLGINLRSDFFYDKSFPFGLSFSYEIGINKPELKSDYATILNSVTEIGDRFYIKLSVPIRNY